MILVLLYLLSGGAQNTVLDYLAETRDRVDVAVYAPERRRFVALKLSEMEDRNGKHWKGSADRLGELQKVLAVHAPDRTAVDQLLEAQLAALQSYNDDMTTLRFELRDELNRDEWNRLFDTTD